MKTIRSVFITLAAVLGLAALAACAQPVTPADYPGGTTGRVILTVSAGAPGAARTVLPEEIPTFSRYELDFDDGVTPVITVSATQAEISAGLNQELTAGTWTVTVRAYRTFTPTDGPEDEYLAAQGSGPVTVAGGAVTPVTVSLTPVQSAGEPGIFTYTVTFPGDVTTATLTLTGVSPISLTSGQTVSIELDPGYYDLVIRLANGAGTLTAGASEKVHIYSGLESVAAYTFTEADFAQTIPLAGTVPLPGGATLNAGFIQVYNSGNYRIGLAAIPAGGTAWAVGVPAGYAGQTLSFRLEALGSDGNIYTATGTTGVAVPVTGMKNITLGSVSQVTPEFLTLNAWTDGDISASGEVDWYTFTAAAAGTYYLQWDDAHNSGGDKTLYGEVSAYRSDGTPVFTGETHGFSAPRAVTVSAGETVYVRVEGSGGIGTYAVRYYNPAASPPLTYPSYIAVQGNPMPASVITWQRDFVSTGYKVYRADTAGGPYSLVGTASGGDSRFFIDTNVSAGATYFYKVCAVNVHGEGPRSPAVSDRIPVPAAGTGTVLTEDNWIDGDISSPGVVDWYTVTAAADTTYYLQWDDGYNIGTGSSKTLYGSVSIYRSDGTPVFLTVGGFMYPATVSVNAGEIVYVRVEGWETTVTGTYAIRYYDPATSPPQFYPSDIAVQGNPASSSVITWGLWDTLIDSATGYKVYRADTIGGTYEFVGTAIGGDSPSFTDTPVSAGATYFYKVCAVNANGRGPFSPPVSDRIPVPAPGTGAALTVNAWTDGDISASGEVDWYTVTAGAAGTYYVQYNDSYDGEGGKTLFGWISAYRSDGTPVFTRQFQRFTYPQEVGLSAGETISVRVEGHSTSTPGVYTTGTYAVRWY